MKACECRCGLVGCASRRGPEIKIGVTIHGDATGYTNGCRCDPCTHAHVLKQNRQRKRVNADTLQTATKHRQVWTGDEIAIATRPGMTAQEAARQLGRTLKAVKNIRRRYSTASS